MNHSCSSTHGKICTNAIFISPSGEWKLGGFELFSNKTEDNSPLYVREICVSFPCLPINVTHGVYGRIVPGLISVGISRDQEGRLVGAERVECIFATLALSEPST